MAVYVFTIGGTPRSIEVETFSISETLNAVETMTIDVRSLPSGSPYRPPINDPVICTEDGNPIFAGLVESAEETGFGGYSNTTGIVTRVTVKSYYQYLARKTLTVTLPAGTLKSQLTALLALYPVVFGLTLSGSQANGPTMPEFAFTQTRGDEILTALMTAATAADSGTGWVAKVDPSKVLRAWAVGDISCGFNVTDTTRTAVGDVTVEKTRNDLYANKIFGIFSGAGPATSTEYFTAADGVSSGGFTRFTTKYPASTSINDMWPSELIIDGNWYGPIEFGVALPFAWSWDYLNHQLVYDESFIGYTFPTGAQQVEVTYAIGYPFTLTAVDAVAYAADPWERTIEIGQGLNLEAAQALLDGMLAQQDPVKTLVHYRTRETAVHPGMTQTVTIAKRDLNDLVLIQEVDTTRLTSTEVIRTISSAPSQVYQGTFRETIAQWMQAGQGNGGVATGAALGALPGGNNRDVQFNDQGAFGGVDGVLIDKDGSGDTYGVEVMPFKLAAGSIDSFGGQLAIFNPTAGLDKALTIWQQDDADTYVEFDGNGSGSDLNIFAYGVGTDLNLSSPRSLQIVDGGYGAISGGLSYVGLRHLVGVDTLLPGAVRQTSSFTIDSAFAGGGRPECVIYLDKTTSATVTLPVTTADTISVGATDGYNRILFFKNINTGVWALTPASGTIEGASSYSLGQNQAVIIGASVGTGAGWHILASFATGSGTAAAGIDGDVQIASSGVLAAADEFNYDATGKRLHLTTDHTDYNSGILLAVYGAPGDTTPSDHLIFLDFEPGYDAAVTVASTKDAYAEYHQAVYTTAASGTHALLTGVSIGPPILTDGGASVTEIATLHISGAATPIGGANAHSLFIPSGPVFIAETIDCNANILMDGFLEMLEMSAPAAPAANQARLYIEDNGSGKTRLMVKFNTGAAQQIAIQP